MLTIVHRTISGFLHEDRGAATAEYAIATMAAVGLAGLLVGILKGGAVSQLLTNLITGALTFTGWESVPVATRGSVSAEFAVLTPTVLALLALALSLLTSVIDRAHLSTTTMWAARSLSMGESESEVTKRVAHSVGVNDDAVSITHRADDALTCVAVTRPARPPASLLGITIEAFTCVPLIAWRGVR